jgi:predicted phage-related endonuclease
MTQAVSQSKELYARDFVAWCENTVTKLKARQFDALDLDNLIEEIESLAKRDRRELESRLDVLLNHLLKRCYISTPENHRGWELTIREQRKELQRLLKQSPSLQNYLSEIFDEVWNVALNEVREDYPEINFPDNWEFSWDIEAILSEEFWSSTNASE